jgi:hypothetical protein
MLPANSSLGHQASDVRSINNTATTAHLHPVFLLPQDDLRDSMPTIPFLSRKGRYVAHTIITSNPSLAPALASGHFYHAAVMDRLFCQV